MGSDCIIACLFTFLWNKKMKKKKKIITFMKYNLTMQKLNMDVHFTCTPEIFQNNSKSSLLSTQS